MTELNTMLNKKGEITGYEIKLKNLITAKNYYNAISELIDTSIIDESVEYPISSTFYKIKIDKPEENHKNLRIRFKMYVK